MEQIKHEKVTEKLICHKHQHFYQLIMIQVYFISIFRHWNKKKNPKHFSFLDKNKIFSLSKSVILHFFLFKMHQQSFIIYCSDKGYVVWRSLKLITKSIKLDRCFKMQYSLFRDVTHSLCASTEPPREMAMRKKIDEARAVTQPRRSAKR